MKPKRHIIDFGERVCPDCDGTKRITWISHGQYGNYLREGVCGHCKGTGSITIPVTFDLWETCPECGGDGVWTREKGFKQEGFSCERCNGTGETPKYWTPEEAARKIKEETGEETLLIAETPVWYLAKLTGLGFSTGTYGWLIGTLGRSENNRNVVLAFPGQPAPPPNYKRIDNV